MLIPGWPALGCCAETGCRRGKVATGPRGEEWAGKVGQSELVQAAWGRKEKRGNGGPAGPNPVRKIKMAQGQFWV
jgi:hypothetical protein